MPLPIRPLLFERATALAELEVPEEETVLRQHVKNQKIPHMRYLCMINEDEELQRIADKFGTSLEVLKSAQTVANELEDLQDSYLHNREKDGEISAEHTAKHVSWGRFAVFDTLMSQMTDEIEEEAKRRAGSRAPVTVQMKRDIKDERLSKQWQALLAANRVRGRSYKLKRQQEEKVQQNAAMIIQQSWKTYRTNKNVQMIAAAGRRAVRTDANTKLHDDARDAVVQQRKLALRYALKLKRKAANLSHGANHRKPAEAAAPFRGTVVHPEKGIYNAKPHKPEAPPRRRPPEEPQKDSAVPRRAGRTSGEPAKAARAEQPAPGAEATAPGQAPAPPARQVGMAEPVAEPEARLKQASRRAKTQDQRPSTGAKPSPAPEPKKAREPQKRRLPPRPKKPEPPPVAGAWTREYRAPKKASKRWLKARTTARLEELSRPIVRGEAALPRTGSPRQENGNPLQEAEGVAVLHSAQKWSHILGRMALGKAEDAQFDSDGRPEGETGAELRPQPGPRQRRQRVRTDGERILHEFSDSGEEGDASPHEPEQPEEKIFKVVKSFQRLESAMGSWIEANGEIMASIATDLPPPTALERGVSNAELLSIMHQRETDSSFIVQASALYGHLRKKLVQATQMLQQKCAKRAAGADGGTEPNTRNSRFAARQDAQVMEALQEILHSIDGGSAESSRQLWRQLSRTTNPIQVLLGSVDSQALVKRAMVGLLRDRAEGRASDDSVILTTPRAHERTVGITRRSTTPGSYAANAQSWPHFLTGSVAEGSILSPGNHAGSPGIPMARPESEPAVGNIDGHDPRKALEGGHSLIHGPWHQPSASSYSSVYGKGFPQDTNRSGGGGGDPWWEREGVCSGDEGVSRMPGNIAPPWETHGALAMGLHLSGGDGPAGSRWHGHGPAMPVGGAPAVYGFSDLSPYATASGRAQGSEQEAGSFSAAHRGPLRCSPEEREHSPWGTWGIHAAVGDEGVSGGSGAPQKGAGFGAASMGVSGFSLQPDTGRCPLVQEASCPRPHSDPAAGPCYNPWTGPLHGGSPSQLTWAGARARQGDRAAAELPPVAGTAVGPSSPAAAAAAVRSMHCRDPVGKGMPGESWRGLGGQEPPNASWQGRASDGYLGAMCPGTAPEAGPCHAETPAIGLPGSGLGSAPAMEGGGLGTAGPGAAPEMGPRQAGALSVGPGSGTAFWTSQEMRGFGTETNPAGPIWRVDFSYSQEGKSSLWGPLTGDHLDLRMRPSKFLPARFQRKVASDANLRCHRWNTSPQAKPAVETPGESLSLPSLRGAPGAVPALRAAEASNAEASHDHRRAADCCGRGDHTLPPMSAEDGRQSPAASSTSGGEGEGEGEGWESRFTVPFRYIPAEAAEGAREAPGQPPHSLRLAALGPGRAGAAPAAEEELWVGATGLHPGGPRRGPPGGVAAELSLRAIYHA
uniref:Uncharacterized protein n=1 Tax=Tetraselmis sp. GSL018 TaxID=582737 RepID=A0A061S7S2_9CHLO|mmetsp:Transcript_42535/g.100954  ORF Transcript_42535/g.100954 Transcript_42535/m.100954 type:complete len:1427 (-) Transcript_42535:155-4435(-)